MAEEPGGGAREGEWEAPGQPRWVPVDRERGWKSEVGSK